MDYEELLRSDDQMLMKFIEDARKISHRNFGRRIQFYMPSFISYKTNHQKPASTAFPSISLTGSSCSLKCKHCEGIVLNSMFAATSPTRLLQLGTELKRQGAVGCLISGGCLPDGSIPLEPFIKTIRRLKEDLNLTILVHTGIISPDTARRLKEAGIDAALIDVIGSNETIKEIFNSEATVNDYRKSLQALHQAGIPTVPHVLTGLHYGELKGEITALEMISQNEPSAVIVIAFMPIHRTTMEHVAPPSPSTIAKILVATRVMMPNTPIALGCMRPKGTHRVKTDMLAVKSGVNAIAFPATEAIRYTESLDYQISFSNYCCSQIFSDHTSLS
ncbi:MAG: radical SAM protein [Candidatus Bathyarchaeota archaeon]|nr:MAG: radical SAM protein [Candidatus Bathyarchaeota archaeon]